MKIKNLRWWIIALLCLGTIANYLARSSLSVMAPVLNTDLGLTTEQYSYVVAAFQLAYTVMQPIGGMLVDAMGLKLGFALFATLWSLANCLHGLATGWMSLAFFRGLLGITEASAVPSGIKAAGEWFPAKERSIAVGWLNAGTSLGAMLAPPLVIFVQMEHSWQLAFVVTGVIGFIFAGLWWFFYDSPARHKAITDEELAHIRAGQRKLTAEEAARKPKMKQILATRRFWGIAIPRFLAEPAWQTFSFWIPLYLATERGMDMKHIAMFAWLPFLTADFGGIIGGYISPFFMKYFRFSVVNSRLAGVCVGAVCMIGPGLIGLVANVYVAIACFCIGGFAHQMISALLNTMSADVFERNETATANGLSGTAAWVGGLSFSLIVGALASAIGYAPLFVCLTVFDIVGAIVAVSLLHGCKSSDEEASEPAAEPAIGE